MCFWTISHRTTGSAIIIRAVENMTKKSAARARKKLKYDAKNTIANANRNANQLDDEHDAHVECVRSYLNTNEFLADLMMESRPCFPIMKFASMNRNGVVRLLLGGRCIGCKCTHLRNVCNVQFITHIADPFLTERFNYVTRVVCVSTHDDDMQGIVERLGGRVEEILDVHQRKSFSTYRNL